MLNNRAKRKIEQAAAAITLDAPLRFSWLPSGEQPQTGCWSFDGDHVIRINEDCPATATRKTVSKTKYALAILEHERAHAVFTERDFIKANQACRDAKAPFMLFNLFEDARIEFVRRGIGAPPLNWLKFDRVIVPKCPISAMFSLMQRELTELPYIHPNARIIAENIGKDTHPIYRGTTISRWKRNAWKGGLHPKIAHIVWTFYCEIVRTPDSLSLQPLMHRWMELFRGTTNAVINSAAEGTAYSGGVSPENLPQINDVVPDENAAPLVEIGGASSGKDGNGKSGLAFDPTEHRVGLGLAGIMSRSFRLSGDGMVNSANPSKRLNLRGLAEGRIDKPFRRMQSVEAGVPNVAVVVDLSLSMRDDDFGSGAPESNARKLLVAFNKLATDGVIKCTAYGTASSGCVLTQQLPTPIGNLNWSAYSGSEGMNTFFGQKSAELSKCDLVLFITDGCIGDSGPNMSFLHQRGIHVIGAYANSNEESIITAGRMLNQFFDKVCVRKDMSNLAHSLAQMISQRA
jgi:hypothetical protein